MEMLDDDEENIMSLMFRTLLTWGELKEDLFVLVLVFLFFDTIHEWGETPSNSTYRKIMCSELVTSKHATKIRTKRDRKHTVRELTHDRTAQDTTRFEYNSWWSSLDLPSKRKDDASTWIPTREHRPLSLCEHFRDVSSREETSHEQYPSYSWIQHQNSVNLT